MLADSPPPSRGATTETAASPPHSSGARTETAARQPSMEGGRKQQQDTKPWSEDRNSSKTTSHRARTETASRQPSMEQGQKQQQDTIGRTSRQPNYPNQLAPKRGSERSFEIGPQSHLVSLSGNLPIVQARDTLSRRSYQPIVLAKPLMAPLISCS